jgi:hypothetical protein
VDQLIHLERLGHVAIGPDAQAVDHVLPPRQCGDHDHRHQVGLPVELELLADLEAVPVRQHQVQQDQLRLLAPNPLDHPLAHRMHRRQKPLPPQDLGQDAAHVRLILDHQRRPAPVRLR